MFPKTTTNYATTFGLHNYSHGKKTGNPIGDGSAVMPLQTISKTIYDFNFHFSNPKEDNLGDKIAGHTLLLGATGTGKTTTQTALMAFTIRFQPNLFVMDLDRGMEIFVRAIGGKENKVKEYIEAEIRHNHLEDYISQVLIPTEKVYTIRNGKKVSKEKVSIRVRLPFSSASPDAT